MVPAKIPKQSMEVKEAKYYHLYIAVSYTVGFVCIWVPALCSLL